VPRLLFADQVLQAAAQFRQRPLPEGLALVYLDGLFLKVLGEEGVERAAVYVALGVTPAGERQVWTNPFGTGKARAPSWATGACPARTPGVAGLVASGPEAGAVVHQRWSGGPSASQRVYPLAEWPRCVVHGVRSSLSRVRVRDRGPLAEDLRRVYRTEALGAEELQARWGGRYPGVVRLWWEDSGAFLRFYDYPKPGAPIRWSG